MRKCCSIGLLCTCLIAAWPLDSRGQNAPLAGEIFFGGSKMWTYAKGSPGLQSGHFDTHGWGGSITGNFNQYVGLEADVFKYSAYSEYPPAYANRYTFLFGPHFAYHRVSRVTPFAHVLLGATRGSQYILPPYPPGVIPQTASDLKGGTAFTVGAGGGLDVRAWRFVWVRVLEADYLHASFPNNGQSSLQLSFGFTLRFGSLRKRP
jgi:hypothetical protein